MAFTVKNFWGYPATTSRDKEMKLLTAVPNGSGGWLLRNITKEDFLKLLDQHLQIELPSGGTETAFSITKDGFTLDLTAPVLTENVSVDLLAAGTGNAGNGLVYNANASPSSFNASNVPRSMMKLVTSSDTIASATIVFPSTPQDGWVFELSITGEVTALSATTAPSSVDHFPATIKDRYLKYVYNAANTRWVLLNSATTSTVSGDIIAIIHVSMSSGGSNVDSYTVFDDSVFSFDPGEGYVEITRTSGGNGGDLAGWVIPTNATDSNVQFDRLGGPPNVIVSYDGMASEFDIFLTSKQL